MLLEMMVGAGQLTHTTHTPGIRPHHTVFCKEVMRHLQGLLPTDRCNRQPGMVFAPDPLRGKLGAHGRTDNSQQMLPPCLGDVERAVLGTGDWQNKASMSVPAAVEQRSRRPQVPRMDSGCGCQRKRRQWHPGLTLIPNRMRKQMSTEAPAQHVAGSLVIQGARTKKLENKQNPKQRQTTPSLIRTHCNRWGVWVADKGKLLVEMRFRSKEPKTHLQCQPPWILYEIKPMEFPVEHETILPVEIFSPWGVGIGLIPTSGEMMFFANSPRRRMMNGTQRRVRPLAWSIVQDNLQRLPNGPMQRTIPEPSRSGWGN